MPCCKADLWGWRLSYTQLALYPALVLDGDGQWGPPKLRAQFPVLSDEGAELELATVAEHAALCKISWLQRACASGTSMYGA